MLFSELHSIRRIGSDKWFDPILDHDTKLFIDPFLIFRRAPEPFANAHEVLIRFFRVAFELAAKTGGKRSSVLYSKLLSLLLFPEVDQLRLGFAKEGHGGAGTASGFARQFATAIMESIAMGLVDFKHFEEIGIFNEGIGRDRISDIAANVLKPQIIQYTQTICRQHRVQMKRTHLRTGFDPEQLIWQDDSIRLPRNPFTGDAVLLVPRSFLRTGPTLDKDGFGEYLWERKNEELRNDFSYTIKKDVDYKAIIKIAREHRDWVRDYVTESEASSVAEPYDLARDEDGLYKWHRITKGFVHKHSFKAMVNDIGSFVKFVQDLVNLFKMFVEKKGGWRLIWDSKSPLSEEGVQNYFYGITYHYCAANNIDLSREVETGRGPVDFKFASGYRNRVLVEAKLARNSHFWANLKRQLPEYMTAEGISHGQYLIVVYTDEDLKNRVPPIKEVLQKVAHRLGVQIGHTIVDARPDKPSSSKLR